MHTIQVHVRLTWDIYIHMCNTDAVHELVRSVRWNARSTIGGSQSPIVSLHQRDPIDQYGGNSSKIYFRTKSIDIWADVACNSFVHIIHKQSDRPKVCQF